MTQAPVTGCFRCRQPASAAAFVTALADAVPGFADTVQWRGEAMPLHRKAVGLAADLMARFGPEDARFAFADAADLPADSGAAARTGWDTILQPHGAS